MSPYSFTCPSCSSNLRSNKPISEFRKMTCPRCSHSFSIQPEEQTDIETKRMPSLNELTDHSSFDSLAYLNKDSNIKLSYNPVEDPPPSIPLSRKLFPLAVLLNGILLIGGVGVALLMVSGVRKNDSGDKTLRPEEEFLSREKERLAQKEKELKEEKDKLTSERKVNQLSRLLANGEIALIRNQYVEAETCFSQAIDLFPDDVSAKAGLVKAKAGLLSTNSLTEDKEKRLAEYERLMQVAKEKMMARQFGAAVRAYQQALVLQIGDPVATKALEQAQQALAADTTQDKKLQDFKLAMEKGRAALVAQRYEDALDAYQAAVQAMPDDLEARRGMREAQARLKDLNKGKDDQIAFDREMTRGKDGLRDRKYPMAITAFERALALVPGNSEAGAALKQARKLQADLKAEMTRHLQLGDMAMAAGRYEEALRNYQKAVAMAPDDPTAQASLQKAQNAFNDIGASQAAYVRFMNQGQLALRSKLYSDAVAAFTEAVRIAPADASALSALQDARRLMDKYLQGQVDVDRLLMKAQGLVQQQQWSDAVKSLNSASQINPDDVRILPMLRKARYGMNMADGQTAFVAKRWADAVRKFDDALQDNPGDPLAKSRRDQAKAMIR